MTTAHCSVQSTTGHLQKLADAPERSIGAGRRVSRSKRTLQAGAAGTRRRSGEPRRLAETALWRPQGADGVSGAFLLSDATLAAEIGASQESLFLVRVRLGV